VRGWWTRVARRLGAGGAVASVGGPPVEGLPDWRALLETDPPLWKEARRQATGPEVLIATSVAGFSALTTVESLLAVCLTLRGARVRILLCDADLPACLRAEMPEVPDPRTIARGELRSVLCAGCTATGHYVYAPLGLPGHTFGALLTAEDRARAGHLAAVLPIPAISTYRRGAVSIGEHAHAGTLRYFASGHLADEPYGEAVLRRYFEAALLAADATERLLRQRPVTVACFNHGIYAPQGVVGDVCRAASTRVVNWNVAYRKRCFIFSEGDTYHHTLLSEPTTAWDDMPWTAAMERDILDYLRSRWNGTRDWIWFHEKPDEAFDEHARALGLDRTRPVVGMLTNVMWDAQLHYRANAFPDMLTWAVQTIRYFAGRSDLQLLIRVHPAEIRGTMPSRQPILGELRKVFPTLPPNVFVIPPESPVSTYAAMMACDAVIIYGTKTGVELASLGIPVIVAGEAWIRNKGLTHDAATPAQYVEILDRLPFGRRSDASTVTRARKYAYHFFFRRMVPIRCMTPVEGWPPYRIDAKTLDDLLPGRDPGLDVICDGILNHRPFVFEAERHGIDES
jgi:hypothetical protein